VSASAWVSRYKDEENDVITIEILNENLSNAEKPENRARPAALPGMNARYNAGYAMVQAGNDALLEAAHTARLLKAAQTGGPANDVQRFIAEMKTEVLTLAERYAGRAHQPRVRRVREA
jgi:hypothetical protein